MLQRCTFKAVPAVTLGSGQHGGKRVAPAALLSKHRSRAAVCSAERPLLVGFPARQQSRSARLGSVAPSAKRRGPHLLPWPASLADTASRLQRNRAATNKSDTSEEEEDDDRLTLVAEQEPKVTAVAPRSTLASYCRLLRSQTLDWRDTIIVVPRVSGKQLLALAAWLNREPLCYDRVAPACEAAEALEIPMLLRDVDLWLEAQEAKESTKGSSGVLGMFNGDIQVSFSGAETYAQQEARYDKLGRNNFDWAMQLVKAHRLPRFKAALMASILSGCRGATPGSC